MGKSGRCSCICSKKKRQESKNSANSGENQNSILFNFYDKSTAKGNHISTCKYTWYNFLFKFLFEQYQRPNNIFFLSVLVCNSIPGLGIVGFGTILTPIIFIFIISAIREIIEDIGRAKSDKLSNSKTYKIVRNGELSSVPASEIHQGDLVIIQDGDEVPADCLLMMSSSQSKIAMVNTASLDGESNLKPRNSILTQLKPYTVESELVGFLKTLWGRISVYPPNSNLTLFTGKVNYQWSHQSTKGPGAKGSAYDRHAFRDEHAILSPGRSKQLPIQGGESGDDECIEPRTVASPYSAVFASNRHQTLTDTPCSNRTADSTVTSPDGYVFNSVLLPTRVAAIDESGEDSILDGSANGHAISTEDSALADSKPADSLTVDITVTEMAIAANNSHQSYVHAFDFEGSKNNTVVPKHYSNRDGHNGNHGRDRLNSPLTPTDIFNARGARNMSLALPQAILVPANNDHETHKLIHFNTDNTLLRGMKLQNTDFAVGAVIYTAYDTRLMMNQTKPMLKLSHVQKRLDRVLVLEIMLLVLGIIICGTIAAVKTKSFAEKYPYAGIIVHSRPYTFLTRGMSYAVLFAYSLPMSLFVSLELVRLVQGIFIEMDKSLRKEELLPCLSRNAADPLPPAKVHCVVKASTLVEDLAEVDIIFSDKTGTLTSNEMIFHSFYTLFDGVQCVYDTVVAAGSPVIPCTINHSTIVMEAKEEKSKVSNLMAFALGLCNTIIVNEKAGALVYQGESPDEIAFAKAAAAFNFIITGREADCVKYNFTFILDENSINPQKVTVSVSYTFPVTVPFTSTRKRMSIVLREQGSAPPDVLMPLIERYISGGSPCPTPNPTDLICFQHFTYSRSKKLVFFTPILLCTVPGNPFLLSKGADSFLLPLCKPISGKNPLDLVLIKAAVDNFSCEGLRTLAWAVRELTPSFLETFLKTWPEVSIRQESDPEYIQHTEQLERDMTFLSASAIEDKLADMVPETLATLVAAGIKVWMLTGDKTQTAINIARSSNLAPLDSEWLYLTLDEVMSIEEKLKTGEVTLPLISGFLKEKINQSPTRNKLLALLTLLDAFEKRVSTAIIHEKRKASKHAAEEDIESSVCRQSDQQVSSDKKASTSQLPSAGVDTSVAKQRFTKFGQQIKEAFSFTELYRKKKDYRTTIPFTTVIDSDVFKLIYMNNLHDFLLSVTMHSTAVVCCRLSPEEKALIVTMTRNRDKYITTLAIGDGANDCPMIKSANIGIGIAGNEGLHASNSSDFSIPEFKYLRRLLFVHGHYTHLRNSELIEYCIYKNLLLVFINGLFSGQCLFTAQILLNDLMVTMYNIVITFLPIFLFALTEHDIKERVLEVHPRVYSVFEKKPETNIKSIGLRMLIALYHSLCMYFITGLATGLGVTEAYGHNIDLLIFGYYLLTEIVMIATIKICLHTKYWSWATVVGLVFTFVMFVGLLLITNYTLLITKTLFNTMSIALRTLHFWVTVLMAVTTALLPDIMYMYIHRFYHPRSYDLLYHQYRHFKKNCLGRALDVGRDIERIEKMNKCLEEVQLRLKGDEAITNISSLVL